ncbi:hypothetical protein [Methylomicrobium lacus]|uniref:hypothetical protein n=1 Tax=Methylomicrobium lacus TaxID=136992 RepID=UPI00045E92ED|nr:hypothetical protein [Methylomicrobium lacus]
MKKQITHISYHQTGKMMAALFAASITLFFIVLVLILFLSHPERFSEGSQLWLRLAIAVSVMPVVSGLFGYGFTLLTCFLYNQIARWVGGIEFTVGESKES